MKRLLFALMIGLFICSNIQAQHSDVEFGYDDLNNPTGIIFEVGESTSDGIAVFEAEFEELDPFNAGDFSADEPGFATNELENFLVNTGDFVWLNALDASTESAFGVGYVNYYNPSTDMIEATGRISFEGNSAAVANGVLNGASIESGSAAQFLGQGDADQEIHDHVVFDLLDDSTAPLGAYGLLFELLGDFDGDGNAEITSDKFWVILNHGMSEQDFEELAVPAFGVTAVPEPGSAALILFGITALGVVRRKK